MSPNVCSPHEIILATSMFIVQQLTLNFIDHFLHFFLSKKCLWGSNLNNHGIEFCGTLTNQYLHLIYKLTATAIKYKWLLNLFCNILGGETPKNITKQNNYLLLYLTLATRSNFARISLWLKITVISLQFISQINILDFDVVL